jgi:hypothetical protein
MLDLRQDDASDNPKDEACEEIEDQCTAVDLVETD